MIKSFTNNFDYIDFITKNELKKGEVFCLNFLPSAFFPKDIIDYYFDKKDHIEGHRQASDKLWRYGREVITCLKSKQIEIAIEFSSLKKFIEKGIVHEAISNFEVSIATKISVIENLISCFESITFLSQPTPFVFRLIPEDTIIIDVDRNISEQTIQGLFLQDKTTYLNFRKEFERLKKQSSIDIDKDKLKNSLSKAISILRTGNSVTIDPK